MRKYIYLFPVLVLCLVACTKKKQPVCVIDGNLVNATEGQMVYFQRFAEEGYVNIDSCKVNEKGHFCFKLDSVESVVRFVGYERNGESYHEVLFPEKGEIFVELNENGSVVKGSPENDKYTDFNGEIIGIMHVMNDIEKQLTTNTTLTEEEKTSLYTDYDRVEEEVNERIHSYIIENIQTPSGVCVLRRNRWRFEADEVANLMSAIPNYFDYYGIVEIKNYVENFKKSAVGCDFIDVVMQTPEGVTMAISEVMRDNKIVLIDFWASWCGPCRREMPHLVSLYEKYHAKGFQILGISIDEDLNAWKEAIQKLHITWPQISALSGWKCEAVDRYAVMAVPAFFLIDVETGKIVARDIMGDELDQKLAELLK
ncbi:MAG: TlpA disulfide reductase family protein [Bacteroidales bacterium]|nr:TlpA disulfide reductase family protein [Bacteroidales bacterium]